MGPCGHVVQRGPVHLDAVVVEGLGGVDAGADTAYELGRRLSVSKQAAAKTIAAMQRLGYVEIEL